MRKFFRLWATAAVVGAMFLGEISPGMGTAVAAPAWPSKPVTIVVSFVPGGATDLVGRIIAAALQKSLNQNFVVMNKPGAAGQVGTEFVARQPADGYTLLISATGHVMAPATQANVNYRPVEDFEPISLLIVMPNMLLVNPDLSPKTLSEFMTWGKSQANISFGSAGAGGSTHLSGELLRHYSGLPLSHVPYKGNGPSMSDAMAGNIPVAISDTVSASALVQAGKLRVLAVTSNKRSPLYPQIPAISELGYDTYDLNNWVGLYAPAGTPADVVARLNLEVTRIMNSPEVLARMKDLGADSTNKMNAVQFRQFVGDEVAKWRTTVALTGVKVAN